MQNALKEPASRFGPVVSSSSPPRYSKPASARPVHLQQSNSKVAADHPGAELRYPSSTLPFLFKQGNSKLTSPASTISLPNALGLSKGPPRIPKGLNSGSTLVNAATSVKKRQLVTSTVPLKAPVTAKKPTKSSKYTTLASTIELVEAEVEAEKAGDTPALPAYNYASYNPKPIRSYIRTATETNIALENMTGPLGLDLEWRVNYSRRKVSQHPVAVVQIADQRRILILQTSAMKGVFPKKLKEILEDATIIKTGVNIRGDAKKLYTDHKIKMQNLVELSWLSRQADARLLRCGGKSTTRTLISLQSLTAAYLERDLVKSPVRTGNWELMLNEEQLNYAANDAHCSVVLHHHLMALAKTEKQALRSELYTLNVNANGEVVLGASEAERIDEIDAFEEGSSAPTPAVPPAPGPVPPPPSASRAEKAHPRPTAPKISASTPTERSEELDAFEAEVSASTLPGPPAPGPAPPSRVSRAKTAVPTSTPMPNFPALMPTRTTTARKKKATTVTISRRPPEIIELSDSDSDLDQRADVMEARTPERSSRPRLTDMELQQLAEAMKDLPSFASASMSVLTSTLASIRKATRLSEVELRQLAEEFQAVNLNEDRMEGVEEEHPSPRRKSPRLEAMGSSPFGAAPLGESAPRVSRTMAYALGVRK